MDKMVLNIERSGRCEWPDKWRRVGPVTMQVKIALYDRKNNKM